ncbi:MAG: c-type cytochrome domain-containing protein [Planctomycetaceae bacterium]
MNMTANLKIMPAVMAAILLAPFASAQDAAAPAPEFETVIAPLLEAHCIQCHGPDAQEGDLRLDGFEGLAAGGKSGSAIVPGSVDESLLIAAIEYNDEALQMPPDGKLPADVIKSLRSWIENGANHPDGDLTPREVKPPFDVDQARLFWAFQPVRRPTIPAVAGEAAGTRRSTRLCSQRCRTRAFRRMVPQRRSSSFDVPHSI